MGKNIFLPNAEQARQMIDKAWQEFRKLGEENGMTFENESVVKFAMDMFVSGYTYGWNDALTIIRGQLEAMDIGNDMFNVLNDDEP